jgi:hypothetical protein
MWPGILLCLYYINMRTRTPISHKSSQPPFDPNYQDRVDQENVFSKLKRLQRTVWKNIRIRIECPSCVQELPDDPVVKVLSDMISLLKESVILRHPNASEFVMLSVPDFDWWPQSYRSRFSLAIARVGIQDFGPYYGYRVSSRTALRSLGLMDCPDYACEGKPPILVLYYTNTTLSSTLMNSGNLYFPCRVRYHLDLGAESELREQDPVGYWKRAKSIIMEGLSEQCDYENSPEQVPVGQIVILGERGNDEGFLATLQDVYDGVPRILQEKEHIFAPARGAADEAREGMIDAFHLCLTNHWCAKAAEMDPESTAANLKEL